MAGLNVPRVAHRFVAVDGVRVFYREAGPPDAPTMLLLHGFPSASHQFRRLIDALGGRYRLIAPDYPGFGHSDAPAAASVGGPFAYTFDRLADVIEGFCARLGLDRFVMYVFDFGAPVGFRAARRSRSTWPSTTIPTSHSTRAGRRGCASTPRRRSSPGAVATPSFRSPAPVPICATYPTPSCTCSTPATSRWRRTSPRSPH